MKHQANCNWEKSNCEYKSTHEYCPHPEHACTCEKVMPMTPDEVVKEFISMLSFEKGDGWKVTESRLNAVQSAITFLQDYQAIVIYLQQPTEH